MVLAATIQALREKLNIASLDHAGHGGVLKTGWPDIDTALRGGLLAGALHEWFGLAPRRHHEASLRTWSPPLCVLVHLAWQALEADSRPRWTVWVGRRCFPYPGVLVRDRGTDRRLLERSLFVTTRNADSRLWAMDLALRSSSVSVVIADGSTFSMAATRRVQLLAKRYRRFVLTVRPPWEQGELSAAQSRWLIRWEPHAPTTRSVFLNPGWSVELLRCKGVHPEMARAMWALEWDGDTSTLNLSSEMARQARAPKEEQAHYRAHGTSRSA